MLMFLSTIYSSFKYICRKNGTEKEGKKSALEGKKENKIHIFNVVGCGWSNKEEKILLPRKLFMPS